MANEQSTPAGEAGFQLSRGIVFPLVGDRRTWSQEHFFPILATILVSLAMMVALQPGTELAGADLIRQAWVIYWIIALYIALMINTYIYHMCQRAAAWWLIAGVAAFTFLLMVSPIWNYWAALFDQEGVHWRNSPYFVVQLAGLYVVGLCEESFKALPLFALIALGAGLAFLGRRVPGRSGTVLAGLARHIRISGPLGGIILGVASGTGFFLYETPVIYLPHLMSAGTDGGTQAFEGLVLLLGRGLPTLTGHCAWSGLFGYFIGLSVLRPKMAVYLLPLGYLSAAALHGAWDAAGTVIQNVYVLSGPLIFLALLSYGLLGGAMFMAREIPAARA